MARLFEGALQPRLEAI